MHEKACNILIRPQLVMKDQATRHQTPQPAYGPRDFTYRSSYHLNTNRPCRKKRDKLLGPFKNIKPVGTKASQLNLPTSIKIHPVFPIELVEPAPHDPLPLQSQPPRPPPLVVKGQEEYKVEEILNSWLTTSGALGFKIRWVSYPMPTWEAT